MNLTRAPGQRRRALRDPVHAMIRELAEQYGKCFATEAGLRRELARRTGYVCGERSIGRLIARSVARGELGHQRVLPNRKLVNGQRTVSGGRHTWIVSRREQRIARRRAAAEERQRRYRAQREERDRREHEQRLRDEAAQERAYREVQREALPRLIATLGFPTRLGATETGNVAAHPDVTAGETASTMRELEQRRRDEVARQLAEAERAGFSVPKKPPDQ